MQTLITPKRVVELAFESEEYIPNKAISESIIASVEQRYLRPILTENLYKALLEGKYGSLRTDFVEPLIAVAVKRCIISDFALRIGQCGVVEPSSVGSQSASKESKRALLKALRVRVSALTHRLSLELDNLYNQGQLPEYDPQKNVHKSCRIYGNLVQTH